MPDISTYAKFYTEADSQELRAFLDAQGIAYVLEKDREVLDKIYAGENFDPMFNLKINSQDFPKVNALVINEFPVNIQQVAKDYYLFTFTNEELIEVIQGGADWNYFDKALAKRILSDKKIQITPNTSTIDEPFTPYRLSSALLVGEYLLAICFAYTGILIGMATLAAYKTTANGNKIKMYDAVTRNHASVILLIGIIRTGILWLGWQREWLEQLRNLF